MSVFGERMTAAVMAACCIFSLCACSTPGETLSDSERKVSYENAKTNQKAHQAIKDILGFDIGDEFIDEAELSSSTATSDRVGNIRIILKSGKGDEVLQLLNKNFGDYRSIDISLIPNFQDHPYVFELKHMSAIKNWTISKPGTSVDFTETNIYMAELNGDTIVYIFS